jgi:acyl-coenzyme A synthetase/AMP-(fatty) acid ligase
MRGVTLVLTEQPEWLTEGSVLATLSPAEGTHPTLSLLRDVDEAFAWLFTGGSTGEPRMWQKTPRNLIGEAAHLASEFDIDSHDIILAAVGPQHIYGLLFSVLLPLVTGASVVEAMPRFHGEIEEAVITHGVTVFVGAPAHYRAQRGKKIPGRSWRLAFSSGGFLPEEDSLWFSAETGVGVTEVYGSTETGGIACRCRAQGESSWTPFDCVQWKINTEQLCIQSPFLSPDLKRDTDGYFTTADRVAPGKGKTFVLRGRSDKVVKVAGTRVELDEVEARIRTLSFVRDTYVFAFSSQTIRSTEIVCLVVPEGDACDRAFRESLQSVLEPSAIPRRVRWVKEIPLTSGGKPDRRAAERHFADDKPETRS